MYRSLGIFIVEIMDVFEATTTQSSILLSAFGMAFTITGKLNENFTYYISPAIRINIDTGKIWPEAEFDQLRLTTRRRSSGYPRCYSGRGWYCKVFKCHQRSSSPARRIWLLTHHYTRVVTSTTLLLVEVWLAEFHHFGVLVQPVIKLSFIGDLII